MRPARVLLILMASVGLVWATAPPRPAIAPAIAQSTASTTFSEDFLGNPGLPAPYRPPGWAVTVLARPDDSIIPMLADHGPECQGPPLTYAPEELAGRMHTISHSSQSIYQCSNHVMTAIWAGYGAIYMSPPALMDWRQGTASLKWDMSTRRTGSRDWVDVVIMPFADNQAINFQDGRVPRNAIHVSVGGPDGGSSVLIPDVVRNGATQRLPSDWYHTWDMVFATRGITSSPARRDHFEITVSRTRLTACMTAYAHCFVDTAINPPLTWDSGVVQFNHRSYNVEKSCGAPDDPNPPYNGVSHSIAADNQQTGCPPNTWHWGTVRITPAIPISIVPTLPYQKRANAADPNVSFAVPAPPLSWLQGAGNPAPIDVSFNGGQTWEQLRTQGPPANPEQGNSFWHPVPTGAQNMRFRGNNAGSIQWGVQDMTLWTDAVAPVPLPPTPTGLPTALPTSTPEPTSTPTLTPSPTATAQPAVVTNTPTPTVQATGTPPATQTPVPVPTGTPTPTPPVGPDTQSYECRVLVTVVSDDVAMSAQECTRVP